MISANDLRNVSLREEENGFSREEVRAVIAQAADTIEAYAGENKELYAKLKLLAEKIEEYRSEEDSIKTALITAQKMADKIDAEAKEEAEKVTAEAKAQAQATLDEASAKAQQTIDEARAYAASYVQEKKAEGDAAIAAAEKTANDAISSSKIIAQDILSQAKGISEELLSASREEKEAYALLTVALKKDAAAFIAQLQSLYNEQLEALAGARLDAHTSAETEEVDALQKKIDSLLAEIDDMEEAIPADITLQSAAEETPAEEAPAEEAPAETPAEEEAPAEPEFTHTVEEAVPEKEAPAEEEPPAKEEAPTDPMEAVAAFSSDTLTPVEGGGVSEINDDEDDDSLFDEGGEQPFESFFKVKKTDAHLDKTQTISLVPPDDFDENGDGDDGDNGAGDGDDGKHKHFFKKKKN